MWIKAGLCLLALVVVLWRQRRGGPLAERRAGQLLGLLAAAAVAAYYNFGLFHGTGYVHYWENFHYFLGSKYFPEVGYDGLYVASIAAQAESSPELPLQPNIRDLRTNQVVPTYSIPEHKAEVTRRFSPARWAAFVADNRHFLEVNDLDYIEQIRTDHGYNPTPTWTFVARLFDRWLPASRSSLTLLALLDPLLLLVMFVVVFRTYGSRLGCLTLIVFGLGYPWRFYWVGGAFLRQDWLAAVVAGVCLLKQKRFGWAGAMFAYATLVRIFPVLFIFGPAVLALRALARRESLRWAWRFAGGFAIALVAGLVAGGFAGRGVKAWPEFARDLAKHEGTWLTNNVGLANLPLYESDTMTRKLVDWSLPEPWSMWQTHMDRLLKERRPAIWTLSGAMLLVLGAAAWRSSHDGAAALGPAVVFALTLLTCYYWVMLIVLPIRRGRLAVPGLLLLNLGLFGLDLVTPAFEMIYGLMSWGLAVLLLAWTLPDAWALLPRRQAPG